VDPVRRIVIVVWSCGPDRPGGAQLAAAPFVYALAARALDLDVEMHFTSSAVRWLTDDAAARAAWTDAAHTKTVRDFIVEAHAAGIRLFACAMALHEHAPGAQPSVESDGIAGAATVMALAAQSDTRILTF
jgi:predicted peroxiredoxin